MKKLEQTIISEARNCVNELRGIMSNEPSEERDHEITSAFSRLGGFVMLAHSDSGLSEEAAEELMVLSKESALIMSATNGDGTIDKLSGPTFEFLPGQAKPYDLSQFKPFETIMFGRPHSVRVTRESLAQFQVMEGSELPSPGALKYAASIKSQIKKN